MRYLLFLFDQDGTLINSEKAICASIAKTLRYFGKEPLSPEEEIKYIGYDLIRLFKLLDIPDPLKAIEVFRSNYFPMIETHQTSYSGITDLLKSLFGKMTLAIVTNKGKEGTIRSLSASKIRDFFDLIVTEQDVKRPKPATDALDLVLKHYRSHGIFHEKTDILMIGDSPVDFEFAQNCGIDFAFASWGFFREEDLPGKPDIVLKNPVDLYTINQMDETVALEITPELDLHTYSPADVKAVVLSYLEEAYLKGFTTVRIVHGKGKGVQKAIVQNILKEHSLVKRFYTAPGYHGGFGATMAELTALKTESPSV